jgi:hypothetical protein
MSWFDVNGAATTPKPALHAISDVVGLQTCPSPAPLSVSYGGKTHAGALRVELRSASGTLRGLTLQLSHEGRILAHERLPPIGTRGRTVTLRVGQHRLRDGNYRLSVHRRRTTITALAIHLP